MACGNAGLKYEFGMGVPKDLKLTISLFERACRLDPASCFRLGILHQQAEGVPKDDVKAKALYAKTCSAPRSARGLDHEAQCEQKVAPACSFAGVAQLALGEKAASTGYLKQGCEMKDAWSCDLQKRVK